MHLINAAKNVCWYTGALPPSLFIKEWFNRINKVAELEELIPQKIWDQVGMFQALSVDHGILPSEQYSQPLIDSSHSTFWLPIIMTLLHCHITCSFDPILLRVFPLWDAHKLLEMAHTLFAAEEGSKRRTPPLTPNLLHPYPMLSTPLPSSLD